MYLTAQDLYVVRELEKKAIRARENLVPKFEDKVIKNVPKKIPIHQN